jgi:hypothetical protein
MAAMALYKVSFASDEFASDETVCVKNRCLPRLACGLEAEARNRIVFRLDHI